MKELPENPLLIGAFFAGMAWFMTKILLPVFAWIFKEKHKDLESKIDHKDLKLQEHTMREWVKEVLADALKEFKVTLKDFKDSLKKEMKEIEDKIEERSDRRYETILNLVKAINHERESRKAQYEGTIEICKDALKEAHETLQLIDKIKKQHD